MASLGRGREPSLLHHSDSVNSTSSSTVYTGISNRTRGWKSRRISDFMEGRIPPNANIKRWDGGARACAVWDSLRRDPELWFDDGNCCVYLCGKGQSRRGPSFRVPLSLLLDANCQPLLNKYRSRDVPASTIYGGGYGQQNESDVAGRVDLYIPPPPMADKKQALDFYLAIRNMFAWICKRSMVGQHLGSALIALMDTMREFRSPGVNNVEDLMSYAEGEGYLDMANQPIHALAMVHLAEYYQLRDLYINAFAHCAGMSDGLYALPEYQIVSSITRKLLRRAHAEVESKLSTAGMSLRNFLEEDLSESNLGLTAGGRAHLERFRTFLLAFYTHRLGYYPPSPMHTRNGMWDPDIYRTMQIDFEALYEYLVDWSFTTSDSASFLRQRGICALQSVHAFDLRHRYRPLKHPLPHLPEVASSTESKRTSWFGKSESKLRPDQRLLAHAALIKATNTSAAGFSRNALVAAYKKFEEDSLCSHLKFDKIEKLSQVDGRKIRWILIYGVYQTLRSCTDAPLEVCDRSSVGYSMAISTTDLPPWKEKRRPSLLRTKSKMSIISPVLSVPASIVGTPAVSNEIRPDIDYFTPTHRDNSTSFKGQSISSGTIPPYPIPPRSGSLQTAPSRTGSLRKPLGSSREKSRTAPAIEPAGPRRDVTYHEIVVHGYGNGTHEVQVDNQSSGSDTNPGSLANRSPSTSSNSSADSVATASDASPRSDGSWNSWHTSIPDTPPAELEKAPTPARQASVASNHTTASSVYSTPDETRPPLPRRNSKRKSLVLLFDENTPAPLQIRKKLTLPNDPDEWRAIEDGVNERCEAVPMGRLARSESTDDWEISDWDSFADVGGLTALPVV